MREAGVAASSFPFAVDGAIVGSALVEVIERGEDPAALLRALRG